MKTKIVPIEMPADVNIIFGMTHFIKTVEDVYEAMIGISSTAEFGIGFCEASGPCLVRTDGNSEELIKLAEEAAFGIACGHTFIIYMRNAYPINFLPRIKMLPEVCRIFCATANPVQVIVGETDQGRGVMGVIDGFMPKGVETAEDKKKRHKFLRDIGYKR
ncbi:MAG: adenosine-specific kinase [candidate division Zixibacteria bacterium]|nr:adenosine-specific kinase [candidate division Zixibacteria bacterium]